MSEQYWRMTLSEAIAMHKAKLISATALLYCYLKIRLKPSWKVTLHQREISAKLGIKKAAYYKAIARLKDTGLIDFEAPNGLVVSLADNGQLGDSLENLSNDSTICPTVENSSTQLENLSTQLENSSTQLENLSNPVDKFSNKTPDKATPDKDSSASTDYYQISNNSLSERSQAKSRALEAEDPWEEPDIDQQENDPDWPDISDRSPEEKTSPARVDVSIKPRNDFDDQFLNGRANRRKNMQSRAAAAAVNPSVWSVEERDEFYRLVTVRLMQENPSLPQGKAKAISDGWCKQINNQAIASPQARELYEQYRHGNLASDSKPLTALEINNDKAFDAAFATLED